MPRGRPRQFDEDKALLGAMQVFWRKGLSATSLDDLAQAMGMNRPSIYNAFGNKDEIYRRSLGRFCQQLDHGLHTLLEANPKVEEGLVAFFDQAIDVYCGSNPQLGCLMVCTAPVEALSHPEVGEDLRSLIRRLDEQLMQRLKQAQAEGQLAPTVDTRLAAQLLQATLHTLAIRARTGASKSGLRKLARYAVSTLLADV